MKPFGFEAPSLKWRLGKGAHDAFENVRPVGLRALVGEGPVFVLAPHPDDESIGCGGLIAACAQAGIPVFIHFLTDGRHSHPGVDAWSPDRIATEREAEARAAAAHLGLDEDALTFERVVDGTLLFDWPTARALATGIAERMSAWPSPVVLAPWRGDPHPDHMAAAVIADLIENAQPSATGWRYLVWAHDSERTPSCDAIVRFSTKRWREPKRRAILAHRTQVTDLVGAGAHKPTPDVVRVIRRDEIYVASRS